MVKANVPVEKKLSDPKPVVITGFFSPFKQNNQPCMIQMPNNPALWVAVFSTPAKLEASCKELGITDYKIKQIQDGNEFLESIVVHGIRVMLDPYAVVAENKTRWTEVILE